MKLLDYQVVRILSCWLIKLSDYRVVGLSSCQSFELWVIKLLEVDIESRTGEKTHFVQVQTPRTDPVGSHTQLQ